MRSNKTGNTRKCITLIQHNATYVLRSSKKAKDKSSVVGAEHGKYATTNVKVNTISKSRHKKEGKSAKQK